MAHFQRFRPADVDQYRENSHGASRELIPDELFPNADDAEIV
jgi:hypothetical protein